MIARLAFVTIFVLSAAVAQADQRFYFGVDIGDGALNLDYDGFNTVGIFSNLDEGREGASTTTRLVFGSEDAYVFGNLRISPEAEITYSRGINTFSNSFPGPPGPFAFFYRGEMESLSVGLMVWADLADNGVIELQGGIGAGTSLVDFQTTDFVVGADDIQSVNYGTIALRANFELSDRVDLSFGVRHTEYGSANFGLVSNVGNVPAGNIIVDRSSTEISLGLRYFFN